MKNTLQLVRASVIILHLLTIPFSINYLFRGRARTHAHSLNRKQASNIPAGGLETEEAENGAVCIFIVSHSSCLLIMREQHFTEMKDTCKYMGQRIEDFFSFSTSRAFCWCKAAGILLHVTAVARLPCLLA